MPRLISIALILLLTGCWSVNQPIEIEPGAEVEGSLRSVNGAMTIGDGARVSGDVSNVNGRIKIGERAQVGSITNVNGQIIIGAGTEAADTESVNGSVSLGPGARVRGGVSAVNGSVEMAEQSIVEDDVQTVNGRISLKTGARVDGKVANIRGKIELDGASVQSIETQAGSIDLLENSSVAGKLWVKEAKNGDNDIPRIVIGPGVQVGGPLQFDREVELLIHDDAEVGEIIGAEAKCFSCEITDI
ncbi:MAG TPA: hypothetical protein VKO38_01300 [Wenzhouxiangella sp.]|nr:hypothetical protein [Wenzhouxiangella sp.]